MLTRYYVNANAKINLFLNVVSKRGDGYHNLESVMQLVRLGDGIEFKRVDKPRYFKIACENAKLPADERNLVHKAFYELKKRYPEIDGLFVKIFKNIPVSAGLGGGSSDCAAALAAIVKMYGLSVGGEELRIIARELGADVPFFLGEKTALAEGIGDILTPLRPVPYCYVVIVRPPLYISTATVFSCFCLNESENSPKIGEMLQYIENGDLEGICACLHNSLEQVTASKHPIIGQIKDELCALGAMGALMSGSGPSVFGVFQAKEPAVSAAKAIRAKFPGIREVFVTTMGC